MKNKLKLNTNKRMIEAENLRCLSDWGSGRGYVEKREQILVAETNAFLVLCALNGDRHYYKETTNPCERDFLLDYGESLGCEMELEIKMKSGSLMTYGVVFNWR